MVIKYMCCGWGEGGVTRFLEYGACLIMIIFRLREKYIKKTWMLAGMFFQWQDIVLVLKPYSLFCILIKVSIFNVSPYGIDLQILVVAGISYR